LKYSRCMRARIVTESAGGEHAAGGGRESKTRVSDIVCAVVETLHVG
jgi:hypothetical protein